MTTTQLIETSEFPRTASVYRALSIFSERMNKPLAPSDGFLTARVIGEFSAGKTRLLRELMGDLIPPALFPVSSLERQTRLQLEITYGKTPELTVIEREADYKAARTISTLIKFPKREELTDYDPLTHRLRLAIPETRLILAAGDRFSDDDNKPKRLFLIDMPGWNSVDDDIAESKATHILAGYHNLSLVFVSNASRLDGAKNSERLQDFLESFQDADFVGSPNLIFIITHCPKADRDRLEARARKQAFDLWSELGHEPGALNLYLMSIDFAELENDELAQFRERFWNCLLAPLEQKNDGHPWIQILDEWPDEWNIRPRLQQAHETLQNARTLLERAHKEGDFLPGMNMHKLYGLNAVQIGENVRKFWLRQLGCDSVAQIAKKIGKPDALDREHPLAVWWSDYWQANLEQALAPLQAFFKLTDDAIDKLTPDTIDLQQHFSSRLQGAYRQAQIGLDSSFTFLSETIQSLALEPCSERSTSMVTKKGLEDSTSTTAMQAGDNILKSISHDYLATLLKLSLIESRFSDHFANAKAVFS